ncbi:MAG: T9SS type A sorting domain-containing protein [Candidatus Kapaibacterium sp.]
MISTRLSRLPFMVIIFMMLFVVISNNAFSQPKVIGTPNEYAMGKVFVIAIPDSTTATNADPGAFNLVPGDEAWVYVYSAVANKIVVSIPGGASRKFDLEAGKFKQVEIMASTYKVTNPIVTESGVIKDAAMRIEAEQPILCYVYINLSQCAEMYTAIPVEAWGTDYNVASVAGESVKNTAIEGTTIATTNNPAGGQALIIAAHDNTVVAFLPACQLDPDPIGGYSVTLNANQVFLLRSDIDSLTDGKFDLSGTNIISSKPINVISGASRARIDYDQSVITGNTCRNYLMEALSPNDAQGTEFVYLPTLDGRQPTGARENGKRNYEYVRVYGTTPDVTTNGTFLDAITGAPTNFSVQKNNVTVMNTLKFVPQRGRYIETNVPSQVVKFCPGVSDYDPNAKIDRRAGRFPPNGNPSTTVPAQASKNWASYMVNLVPREQWVSFAPFYVPTGPRTDINNYYGIVTDTSNIGKIKNEQGTVIIFNKFIPGTRFVWAMNNVNVGPHYFESTNGGKFYAEIFGLTSPDDPSEVYIPGTTSDPPEYDETPQVAYGYPAAPNRFAYRREDTLNKKLRKDLKLGYGDSLALRMSDTLVFREKMECANDTLEVQVINTAQTETYVGLRSIELSNPINAKINYLNPTIAIDIAGSTIAKVAVVPIDISKDASATIVIKDRSGKKWTRPYSYQREYVDFAPIALDFGTVSFGEASNTLDVTVTNPLQKNVNISQIQFEKNNQGYEVINMPKLPLALKPLEQFVLKIRIDPKIENGVLTDFLNIKGGCADLKLPLKATSIKTCIYVDDIFFPTMEIGQTKTAKLNICCREGRLTFSNPKILEIVTWADKTFKLDPLEIAALKNVILKADSCVQLNVSYTATAIGEFKTVAKVFSNAISCYKDSSNISALVREPGKPLARITGYDFGKQWVINSNTCTKNKLNQYVYDIYVNNEGGANFTVKSLVLTGKDADDGYFALGVNPAVTPGLKVFYGDSVSSRKFQQIIFKPKDERFYTCKVVLTTEEGQVREAEIKGEGTESHIQVSDKDWGVLQYVNVPYPDGVSVKGLKTRRTTVTGLTLTGDPEFTFGVGFVLPSDKNPKILDIDEDWIVPIQFKATFDGVKTSQLCVISDHSKCDDSCATLKATIGKDPVFNAGITPVTFRTILSCNSDTNFVLVTNTGDQDLLLKEYSMNPITSAFGVVQPFAPIQIKVNGQGRLPVYFNPLKSGDDSATINIVLYDAAGTKIIKNLSTKLYGKSIDAVTNSSMRRDYFNKPPTGQLAMPINLDKSIDEAKITSLTIALNYGLNTIALSNGTDGTKATLVQNTIIKNWTPKITKNVQTQGTGGFFEVELTAPAGEYLKGTGPLLNLDFGLFLGDKDTNQVFYTITPTFNKCVVFNTTPGFVQVDSVCGSRIRVMELTGAVYALKQNSPNPFNPSTDIDFSLGLDGKTSIDIYNEAGAKVASLVNQHLNSGTYRVTWDAASFPTGLYYYRLTSGTWSQTNAMMLQK